MPKFKEIFKNKNIQQKHLLEIIHNKDSRVDKPLLSKFVNYVCLPTPEQMESICEVLKCEPLDIYSKEEIQFIKEKESKEVIAQDSGIASLERVATEPHPAPSATAEKKRERRKNNNIYMLAVEIDREIAEKVFSPVNMKKLRIHDRSDFVRKCVYALYKKLLKIEAKEKSPASANANDNSTN